MSDVDVLAEIKASTAMLTNKLANIAQTLEILLTQEKRTYSAVVGHNGTESAPTAAATTPAPNKRLNAAKVHTRALAQCRAAGCGFPSENGLHHMAHRANAGLREAVGKYGLTS